MHTRVAVLAVAGLLCGADAGAVGGGARFRDRDFSLIGQAGAALTFDLNPFGDDPSRLNLRWGRTLGAGVDLRFYRQGGEGLVVRAQYLDVENDDVPSARTLGALFELGAAYRFTLARGRRLEWIGQGNTGLSGMAAQGSRATASGLGVATGVFAGAGVDLRVAHYFVTGVAFSARYLSTWFVPNVPSWVEVSLVLRLGVDF